VRCYIQEPGPSLPPELYILGPCVLVRSPQQSPLALGRIEGTHPALVCSRLSASFTAVIHSTKQSDRSISVPNRSAGRFHPLALTTTSPAKNAGGSARSEPHRFVVGVTVHWYFIQPPRFQRDRAPSGKRGSASKQSQNQQDLRARWPGDIHLMPVRNDATTRTP